MNLQLTSHNLNTMFENKHMKLQQHAEGCQRLYGVQLPYGEVDLKRSSLRDGLEISEYGGNLKKRLSIACEATYPHLELSHTFSGQGNWAGVKGQDCELSPGTRTLVYMRDRKVNAELLTGQELSHIEVRIDLRHFPDLADELKNITANPFYAQQVRNQPQLDQLFQQLQQCEYNQSLQRLYLEGKCYELLACYLATAETGLTERSKSVVLTVSDLDALKQAHHILHARWISPPGLIELARMVGITITS